MGIIFNIICFDMEYNKLKKKICLVCGREINRDLNEVTCCREHRRIYEKIYNNIYGNLYRRFRL